MSILWRVNVAVEMTQSHCNITVSMLKAWENRTRPRVLETLKAADPLARPNRGEGSMQAIQCAVDGCTRDRRYLSHGVCHTCYVRLRNRGELDLLPTLSTAERLDSGLIRQPSGCLEWIRFTTKGGYGQIRVKDKMVLTHRLAWVLVNGPIPEGMCVRHFVCDNPPCCETTHLRLGTDTENVADKIAKGRDQNQRKTQCVHGHPFNEANTHVTPEGWRTCRTCNKDRDARYKAKRSAGIP